MRSTDNCFYPYENCTRNPVSFDPFNNLTFKCENPNFPASAF